MSNTVLANAPVEIDDVTGAWAIPVTSVPSTTPTTTEKTAQVKFEPATAGDNVVVPAVGGKKIRVTGYNFSSSLVTDAVFRTGTSAEISAKGYSVTGGEEKNANEILFETVAGEALNLNVTGTPNLSCQVTYVEV